MRKKAVMALHHFHRLDPRRDGALAGVDLDRHFRTMLCDKVTAHARTGHAYSDACVGAHNGAAGGALQRRQRHPCPHPSACASPVPLVVAPCRTPP